MTQVVADRVVLDSFFGVSSHGAFSRHSQLLVFFLWQCADLQLVISTALLCSGWKVDGAVEELILSIGGHSRVQNLATMTLMVGRVETRLTRSTHSIHSFLLSASLSYILLAACCMLHDLPPLVVAALLVVISFVYSLGLFQVLKSFCDLGRYNHVAFLDVLEEVRSFHDVSKAVARQQEQEES